MKLKIKETYLILLIVISLISLGVYSTYALFTASTEISDVVGISTTLDIGKSISEYEIVSVASGDTKLIELNVVNSSSNTIYYGAWYKVVEGNQEDIEIGLYTEVNFNSSSGSLTSSSSINLLVGITNNSDTTITIYLGVKGSTTNELNISSDKTLLPSGWSQGYIVNLTVVNGISNVSSVKVNKGSNAIFNITANDTYGLYIDSDTCKGSLVSSTGVYTIANITENKSCILTLKKANLDTSGANTPDLVEGLIPVMYKEDQNTWVVADYTNTDEEYKWYDYNNKIWANAVLVTDSTRNSLSKDSEGNYIKGQTIGTYLSSGSGTIAFYVWIPRYKYKVWNINKVIGTDSYNALTKGIDIIFESGIDSTGEITCTDPRESLYESCTGSNGKYYTHPAFTFGDDELRGFWMSKFESIISTFSIVGVGHGDDGGNTVTSYNYVVSLPNMTIEDGVSLDSATSAVNRMQSEDKSYNTYGLSTSIEDIDTHVLTNMEWGATSYLTYSEYGRCKNKVCEKVSRNSYMEYVTGMGNSDDSYIKDEYTYSGSEGVKASTTGNITGIYDMYGGLEEWTMGTVLKDSSSYEYSKYLVKYANGDTSTDQAAYNRGKLGGATGEVVVEYEDEDCILFCAGLSQYANFPVNTYYSDAYGYPYFICGGSINSTVDDFGIFYFNYAKGMGNASDSNRYNFRVSLISLK